MTIVIDTSFLVAFHNDSDPHHPSAVDAMSAMASGRWGDALLPEYVLVETITVVMARCGLDRARMVGVHLIETSGFEIVAGTTVFGRAWDVFRFQPGPRLSFVDAAVVAVARLHGARHVATFDSDFRGLPGLSVVPR